MQQRAIEHEHEQKMNECIDPLFDELIHESKFDRIKRVSSNPAIKYDGKQHAFYAIEVKKFTETQHSLYVNQRNQLLLLVFNMVVISMVFMFLGKTSSTDLFGI
jgi:hypothetical protein